MKKPFDFNWMVMCAGVLLLMLQPVFAVQTVPLEGLEKPEAIQADGKQLYITDGLKIKIYSLEDFKLKKTVGKEGEGPREFQGFLLTYVQPEYIFVNSVSKVSWFTLDGEFIKEKRTSRHFGRFKPIGKSDLVGYFYSREGKNRLESIYLYNGKFEKIKELYTRKHIIDKQGKINILDERPPFFYIMNNKIILDGVDGAVRIYDSTGKKIHSFPCPMEPIPFTGEHEKKFREYLRTTTQTAEFYRRDGHRLDFPDNFPLIRMFHASGDRVYLMTYKEKEGKNEFLVMDMKGKLVKRVFVPIATYEKGLLPVLQYTVANGKIYHLVDNEETEEWEVRIHEL